MCSLYAQCKDNLNQELMSFIKNLTRKKNFVQEIFFKVKKISFPLFLFFVNKQKEYSKM